MRILLLLSESWNDQLYPNNNMTNWFFGFKDAEIWTISGSAIMPSNQCCKDYFLISEPEMVHSLYSNHRAGKTLHYNEFPNYQQEYTASTKKRRKKITGETLRLMRDLVWQFGKYDENALEQFIRECNPDIIFSQRRGSVKMCRMENLISRYSDAPMVAFTGDDEYSLQQFSWSPVFWIRRFWVRHCLKQRIPNYKLFYSMSDRQMQEFEHEFGVRTKFLAKCGMFSEERIHKTVGKPIQIVYAGKFYCNRWKTLALVAEAIKDINEKAHKILLQLNLYTADPVSAKQNKLLNDGLNATIHDPIKADELPDVYKQSDIILHVESFDLKNRLLTQDSFSTKVIDCLASGCAVMAVCWKKQAAFSYLKQKDAAIAASSFEEIKRCLQQAVCEEDYILEYARKAYRCGSACHDRKKIQEDIKNDFEKVIKKC